MKTQTLVIVAFVGFGLWYLSQKPTFAEKTGVISSDELQARFDAVRRARANLPPLKTAQAG